MTPKRKTNLPPRLTADCSICGKRIQRNGVGMRWRHQRCAPDGGPNDHNAHPVPLKKGAR